MPNQKRANRPWQRWMIAALAVSVLSALLSGCSTPKEDEQDIPVEEMYAIAKKSMDKKNWLTAVDELRKLEAKYPYGTHAEQAQLDTIYAYYRAGETGLILAAAERFIKLHPTHPSVDYAYYAKGLANYQESDTLFGRLTGRNDLSDRDASITRNALNAFNDVYTLFPASRYAADARARARYLYDSLARHELTVATYYFSRNAHVAVVNRAKGVIEDYATTPSVEEALALLMFCYRQMELDDLSADTRRVLELNFPKSAYLDDAGKVALMKKLQTPGASNEVNDKDGFFSSLLE